MTKRTLTAVAVISLSATLWLGCGYTSGDEKNNVSEEQQEITGPDAGQLNVAVLGDEWQVDSDQNGIPDFIEKESGYNPAGEDCNPEAACGEGVPGADLDLSVNTLLMLDVSGSMAARLGGVPKIDIAKMSLLKYASSVPESIRLGLLVYGHQGNNEQSGKAESCAGIEVMAPIGNLSEANANTIINRFSPTGWTPIASALEKAKQTFGTDRKGRNRIIMVSDGVETCGGDPVSVARQLHSSGFAVTIDVVGFNVPGSDAQQLKRIAEAGGGIYFDARTQSALDTYFQEQNRAAAKTWEAANCYAEAYNKAWLCDANMVLKAIRVLNAESRKAQSAGKNDEVRALEEVRLAINQKHEERKKQRKIIREKWHKLSRDAFEINQKTLKAYGKMRRSP
ncbi:MAG: hypothetical protein BGO21_07935 [Dyadobacter sp. 50-39]|uniref:VWA domain-containing protein n=1 Tax=Dyadobacter sp. 50-39 TaxID=1895756 RepID=UPI000964F582|nr:VWA domain-containing protein [Dyadobacter sp. 50-39]OJV20500.1 MAG: hypothetical protein BGO21_07935 [Dyadobacter sp. 50-39]